MSAENEYEQPILMYWHAIASDSTGTEPSESNCVSTSGGATDALAWGKIYTVYCGYESYGNLYNTATPRQYDGDGLSISHIRLVNTVFTNSAEDTVDLQTYLNSL